MLGGTVGMCATAALFLWSAHESAVRSETVVDVVVSLCDLEVGERVEASCVVTRYLHLNCVDASRTFADPKDVIGRVVVAPLLANEAVREERLSADAVP